MRGGKYNGQKKGGYTGKILRVNLTDKSTTTIHGRV
jgi:hypothetical protein